jgi:hypothetical protein
MMETERSLPGRVLASEGSEDGGGRRAAYQ